MENKKIAKAIFIFISYFIYSAIQIVPLKLLGIDYNNMSITTKVMYLLGMEFLYIIFLIICMRKRFNSDIKDYFKNFKTYIKGYFKYWSMAFFFMVTANVVITLLLPNSIATNQELINETFKKAPIYIIVSSVIFAPFIEETIFRLSIRNMFKNDKVFIVISGLVFGALHVVGSFEKFSDLIYIIVYSIPGFFFAYTLVKSKNIFVPMSLHFFHNAFMMSLQVIAMFLL